MTEMAKPLALVIEDDVVIAMGIEGTLETQGFQTLSAMSVPEAKKIIAGNNIKIITCDDNLKGAETGQELYRWLRQNGNRTPIVFITGNSRVDADLGKGDVAFRFFGKPVNEPLLIQAIRELGPTRGGGAYPADQRKTLSAA